MMMKLMTTYLLLMLWCGSVFAGEQRQIELTDGSVISGEIVSFSGGVYTIKSTHLGILKIEDSKVRSIHSESGSSNLGGTDDVVWLQKMIMSRPDLMNKIISLQNDPEVQAVLQNPEVMSAVASGNIDALLSNPLFMKLMENPKIKEIAKEAEGSRR
jgi:ABC-type amino acid transport substrate-binding protein